jgi:hypothetical protein
VKKVDFYITPAELFAHLSGSAKRPSVVNDIETAAHLDASKVTDSEVAALLPSNCPPDLVHELASLIRGARYTRAARSQMRQTMPEALEEIRQKLLRLLPAWVDYLEANFTELRARVEIPGFPLSGPNLFTEIDRLKRLLAVVSERPRVLPDQISMHPYRANPDLMLGLFENYQKAFPKGRNGQPTGISRDGPANKFIVGAIKLIGWQPMTPQAVEMMLRRARDKTIKYQQEQQAALERFRRSSTTNSD